jgi:dipeptidase E
MKLLLTSSGINNKETEEALLESTGKPFEELNVAFIPTAAHFENGDKHWLIKQLQECVELGFGEIDIVDIAVVSKERWLAAFEKAQIIIVGGGGEGYLLQIMKGSGFTEEIERLLENRVYVGISAGAMALTPRIIPQVSKFLYKEPQVTNEKIKGLNLVNFSFFPHLDGDDFTNLTEENIRKITKEYNIPKPIYALADGTALQIIDNNIKIIGDNILEIK